jgi:acyl-CoA reductase-like NAD-dependent aldehyde dehydrogenase
MVHAELLIDGMFVGGPCDQSIGKGVIRAPFDGAIVGTAAEGGQPELRAAVDAAASAFDSWRRSPRHARQALLENISGLVRERADELAELLSREVGKPIVWSRAEVVRLALTFDFAAQALSDWGIDAIAVDLDPRGEGMRCVVERFPIGPIFCIVPYNWPFNLAAHKIAPALATGNTVILKPSPLAPLSTLALARLIHEAGCPPGVVNAWNGRPEIAEGVLIEDKRIRMLSFTGSAAVGWKLKSLLPDRKVVLELGGNASAIVHKDADLEWAVSRLVSGGYGYAGQVCISVQHVLAHEQIADALEERLIDATNVCPTGDPLNERTVCGPLVSDGAADRVHQIVNEAVAAGARVLAGGGREGRILAPTFLTDVPPGCRLDAEEVFGPVLTLRRYRKVEEAVAHVNRSAYGIQAGVFTRDSGVAEFCFRNLEVGGVIVDDYPTLRFDNFPYGGVKRSGVGREGVRFAMDEMTEPRTLLMRNFFCSD